MKRQGFASLIRISRVLSLSLLVVMLSGLLKPEAAVQAISFGAKTDFGTGTGPSSIAVGDFNGDGTLDLAVANFESNTVSILLGTGTGSLGAKTDFGTGTGPGSVAVGDFNGDGTLDLAVANNGSDTVSILLGNGDGTFGGKTDFGTGTGPQAVTVGDFNGDGTLDLAVANFNSNTVSILLGNGDGTFGAKHDFGTGSSPSSVAVADFNGDGKLDLAVVAGFDTVAILLGKGDGTFGGKTSFGTGSLPDSVAVGDFNGDGKLDLAVANNNSGTVSILLGKGTGSFGAKTDFVTGDTPRSLTAGDFNGDGKLDLAMTTSGASGGTVSILLGTGAGTFGTRHDFGTGGSPESVAVGDFNGDGKLDLAVANFNDNTVSILLNTTPIVSSSGVFCHRTDFGTGMSPVSLAVGDFNGDGKLDLAVANRDSNTVSILLGMGAGSFGAKTDFGTGSNPRSVAVGDFNGDGTLDLAVASSINIGTVSILLGNGDGTFGGKTDFGTGSFPNSVAVGDFNGDGKLDLAVTNNNSNTVSILLGNGDGTFGAKHDFGTGSFPESVAVGDFNGDGKLDLAVANSNDATVSILLGKGNGTFGGKTNFGTGSGPFSVAVGDFNGDGKRDLAVTNLNDATVSILLGKGTGSFGPKTDFGTGIFPFSVAVGDFNGDGKLDLAVSNSGSGDNTVSILPGTGAGTFGAKTDFGTGTAPASVAVGDFNGFGTLDLAVANLSSNTVSILLNNTPPNIGAAPVTLNAGNPSANSQIATVDDAQEAPNTLSVTVNSGTSATVNGVTVTLNPTAPNASGQVFADVVATCAATAANFTLRVTDSCGNFTEATLTATVNPDNQPPTINCAGVTAQSANADASCSATVPDVRALVIAQSSDNCTPPGSLTVTQNPVQGSTVSGSGSHPIKVTVTDASNNSTDCTVTFTVNDTTAPVINCGQVPAQSANANANCQATVPDVRLATLFQSSDNCTAQASLSVTQNPVQGSTVSGAGPHPIVVTVTDASNNSTNCTVAFAVNDTTAPVITCGQVPAQSANANANCQATVPDARALVSAQSLDNCTAQGSLTVTQNPTQGSTVSGSGPHPIKVTVTDASNNSTDCTVAFIVNDVTSPTINCAAVTAQSAIADANCQAVVPDVRALVRAQSLDNCTAQASLSVTQNPVQGSTVSGAGPHPIVVKVADASSNSTNCTVAFAVKDVTPPTITCPGNIVATAAASCPIATSKVVTYPDPVASDNCGVQSVVCDPPSGSTFPVGTITVTCTATDTSGNTATCSFTVTTFSFCLQDDSNSGNVVLVNAQTGDFSFCCGGVPIASGRGTLTAKGCIGSIDAPKGDRQVHIQWDTSANSGIGEGTAYVMKRSTHMVCQITDKNMTNKSCTCQ